MAIDIISSLLQNPYSFGSIFILTFLASFIVIPAMGFVIVSFGAASTSFGHLLMLLLLVYIAAVLGDISAYFIARFFSKPVLKFMRRFKWYDKSHKKYGPLLEKYESYLVFLSRFTITEACLVVNYIAGFTRFNSKKFIVAVLLGELVYAAGYTLFGYFFRDTWNFMLKLVQSSIWIIILVVCIFLLIRHIKNILKKRNKQ